MREFFKNNGLTIALLAIFSFSLIGQYISGWKVYAEEELQHGNTPVGLAQYVAEPHFLEALFENWESEFLQMAVYVLFTAFLYQKGSSDRKLPAPPNALRSSPNRQRTIRGRLGPFAAAACG